VVRFSSRPFGRSGSPGSEQSRRPLLSRPAIYPSRTRLGCVPPARVKAWPLGCARTTDGCRGNIDPSSFLKACPNEGSTACCRRELRCRGSPPCHPGTGRQTPPARGGEPVDGQASHRDTSSLCDNRGDPYSLASLAIHRPGCRNGDDCPRSFRRRLRDIRGTLSALGTGPQLNPLLARVRGRFRPPESPHPPCTAVDPRPGLA
jgi:hypothetical protein